MLELEIINEVLIMIGDFVAFVALVYIAFQAIRDEDLIALVLAIIGIVYINHL